MNAIPKTTSQNTANNEKKQKTSIKDPVMYLQIPATNKIVHPIACEITVQDAVNKKPTTAKWSFCADSPILGVTTLSPNCSFNNGSDARTGIGNENARSATNINF
ncbi:MAG: hypothetical protein JNL67_13570 [Planctomycetaceae bacterium]|nr:hypothetical protein [Planctomycetaceae bacterium]